MRYATVRNPSRHRRPRTGPGSRRHLASAVLLPRALRDRLAQTRRLADYTLAYAHAVGRIAAEAKVQTLVLTHHRQKSNDLLEEVRQDATGGFGGTGPAGA
jgi:hypothetical protein